MPCYTTRMERAFPQSIEAERSAHRAALVFESRKRYFFSCLNVEGDCGTNGRGERYCPTQRPVVVSFIHGTVDVAIGREQGYGLQDGGAAVFLRLASPGTAAIVQACGAGSCDSQARGAKAGDPDYFPLDALMAECRRGDHGALVSSVDFGTNFRPEHAAEGSLLEQITAVLAPHCLASGSLRAGLPFCDIRDTGFGADHVILDPTASSSEAYLVVLITPPRGRGVLRLSDELGELVVDWSQISRETASSSKATAGTRILQWAAFKSNCQAGR
ncbi:hypothetical protein HK405_008754 [Cladochytrium tenue]|nr:hypothetical protein HK405_008754 [Cladochytrium tenue]